MNKHEQVYNILKGNKIFSKSAIEKEAGMTRYKLHAFLHNKAPITDEEAAKVLEIVKNAHKLQN